MESQIDRAKGWIMSNEHKCLARMSQRRLQGVPGRLARSMEPVLSTGGSQRQTPSMASSPEGKASEVESRRVVWWWTME